jgi:thymidylate synthase
MYRNATSAFIDLLDALLRSGDVVVVRGQEIKELRSRLITIQLPTERVYVIPNRRNNIFGTIAEAVWVIAGRNDVAFLERYLERAREFSDDGKVWRAGYGPRLRDWYGTDQLKEVVRILKDEPSSRRAALSLFDPARDYIDSKDVPCNNWLHFLIRDNRVHLNAAIRSNDVMWGFSGINTFEWSLLLEMMAYWTGCQVGEFSYFVSSLHIYNRHYKRAQEIISARKDKTLYDFGFGSAPFETTIETLDDVLTQWFDIENRIRTAGVEYQEIDVISDNLLRNCLQMLWIYNKHLDRADKKEIAETIAQLPSNDFKVAAIEYFARTWIDNTAIALTERESAFFEYLWSQSGSRPTQSAQGYSFEAIINLLSELHYKKTLAYKDSWKRQGEVLGVFCNIARKFDRIESLVGGAKPTSDESLIDTLADLAVYATKYLTYLAENYPGIFEDFIRQYPPLLSLEEYADNLHGFDAVAPALISRYVAGRNSLDLTQLSQCYDEIERHYSLLREILTRDGLADDPRKCSSGADLAIGAVHYLVLLSREDPETFGLFVDQVGRL